MEVVRKTSVDFTRLFDILSYQQEKYPNALALNAFQSGKWIGLSIQDIQQRVNALSYWFIQNGFQKGEKVIFVPVIGSPEWMMLDFACQQAGLITVPVHPTSTDQEIELIFNETEAKMCLTADAIHFQKFQSVVEQKKINIQLGHLEPGAAGYFQPLTSQTISSEELIIVDNVKKEISENDILSILYTSGSSGVPKGVLLTHRNLASNIKAILTVLPLEPKHQVLSFLPFSHIFERSTCYTYMAFGVSLYFSQNKESFAHDFKTVRPHFCTCVPRVLEKMYDFMQEQMLEKNPVKKKLIAWALSVGKKYRLTGRMNILFLIQLFFARVLVLNQWRKKLGGRISYMAVGAASLRPEIGRLFSAAGIQIVEGYGLTETSPIISMNRFEPGLTRLGTVGIPLTGVDVKLDELNDEQEGEILVKGPNVTQGYFMRPELTAQAFTEDGWFRTGDVGKFVHQRFLQITDRKKDIFKTSSGKYIAPQPLQNHFAKSPFIQRCLILGFQRPFVTALLVPHFEILEAWCIQEGIHWTSPQFMVHNIKVRAKLQEEVDSLNEELPNFQRVRNFIVCDKDWSTETGELTTTMKPIRHLLVERHKAEIEKMYQ
jgi:long-chain acyl-CoA synthetase